MTWDLGRYEHIAAQLLPVAVAAVDQLHPLPDEFVVDLGCGTGNAALLAAARGAKVLGIDPTPRLLGVAQQCAKSLGLEVRFELGEAASMPLDDGSADAIVSVFAVIFASDAAAAAAEIDRVLNSKGRIVLTAWLPGGVLGPLYQLRQELIADVRGTETSRQAPFKWHDWSALDGLIGHLGFAVELEEAELTLKGDTALDFIEAEFKHGPLWVEARSILEPAGRWQELRDAAARTYNDANEDPPRFRLTTPYVMASARRAIGASS